MYSRRRRKSTADVVRARGRAPVTLGRVPRLGGAVSLRGHGGEQPVCPRPHLALETGRVRACTCAMWLLIGYNNALPSGKTYPYTGQAEGRAEDSLTDAD